MRKSRLVQRPKAAAPALAVGAGLLFWAAPALAVNPSVPGLGNNSWVALTSNSTQRYVPDENIEGNYILQTTNPRSRDFSGTSYGGGRIFLFGGGHCSYQGNDVETYDVGADSWTQSWRPEHRFCGGGTGCSGEGYLTDDGSGTYVASPLCRPQTEHTYQQMAYDRVNGRMIAMLKSGTWAFDPVAKAWTALAGRYASPQSFTPTFWTAKGILLETGDPNILLGMTLHGDPNGFSVYTFNIATRQWTRVGSPPSNFVGTLHGIYVPDGNYFLIHDTNWAAPGTKSLWKYELTANRWTNLTSTTPSEILYGTGGWAFDTLNRVVVAVPDGGNGNDPVWIFRPTTSQWTRVGTAPFSRGMGESDLQYDATHNVFYLTVHTSWRSPVQLWAYRYQGGTPSGDTTPPAPPAGLRAQ